MCKKIVGDKVKRFYKLLLILIMVIIYVPYVYAANTCEGQNFNNKSEQYTCEYENGIKKDFEGCNIYNKEYETIYKTSGKHTVWWGGPTNIQPLAYIYVEDNIPVTSAWSVIDNDGKAVYAGCYEGYLMETEVLGGISHKYTLVSDPTNAKGTKITKAYYLKVLASGKTGKCISEPESGKGGTVLIPSGVILRPTIAIKVEDTDGQGIYGNTGFTPTETSGCPLNFNLTDNYQKWWLPSLKNRYIFTNDDMPTFKVNWFRSAFSTEEDITVSGTISEEKAGYEETKQCYTDVANKEIPKYSCSEMNSFSDKLKSYQTECKSDRKTHYMRDFDEKNQSEFLKIIADAVNKRINECYLEKCGITSTSSIIQKLSQSKYSNCSNGCVSFKIENTLNSTNETQSSSSSCSSCYSTFYNDMALQGLITETQKACLLSNLNEQVQTMNSELGDIKSDFVDTINEGAEQSQKTRNENARVSYAKFDPPEINGGIFGRGGSCSQILGTNGIKILKGVITTVRIVAPIIAIINAIIILLPAVTSKDADGLKKASSKCVKLAVILAVIEIFPSVIKLIGALFGWDTCGI